MTWKEPGAMDQKMQKESSGMKTRQVKLTG